MGTLRYYAAVAEQAFKDTLRFFNPDKKSLVSISMFLIGLAFWWRFRGAVAAVDKVTEVLLFVLVPGAFAFFGLFAWNLVQAPVRLRVAERAAHDQEIKDRDGRIAALDQELNQIKLLHMNRELRFEPLVIQKSFTGFAGGKEFRIGQGLVAQLRISNEPTLYGGMVFRASVKVIAEITYSDVNATAFKVEGRWADSPLPGAPDDAVRAIEIAPGESRKLDVAVNLGQGWYALDNKSPFSQYQVRQYKLGGYPIRIRVRIKGDVDLFKQYEIMEENGVVKFDEV